MNNQILSEEIKELSFRPKKKQWYAKIGLSLILMAIPTIVYIFIFHYLPIGGLIISFKDYSSFKGLFDSPWTSMGGFKHFYTFVSSPNFWTILKNTLALSVASIVFNSSSISWLTAPVPPRM